MRRGSGKATQFNDRKKAGGTMHVAQKCAAVLGQRHASKKTQARRTATRSAAGLSLEFPALLVAVQR
ncbi:hypothetical protein MPLDJ20_120501 [Mesorhizobium plurifarium]|uniref:Uncharacterized protein n=1 Tax=Mesorhizobium plurifarium TaxID=69974 RepID=A0A090GEJ5_MESPL|nr:hypothetical protein MPLDJ20_120501 [Mesorhizobium plurifarium]CDX59049.1 hypothetical protein MPL3365_30443 [Mesorhizobium plurifarium]